MIAASSPGKVIIAQKAWLKQLQIAQPRGSDGQQRPILCSYSPEFRGRDGIYRRSIVYGRTILKNEIVFDFDSEDWSAIKSEGDRLVSFLQQSRIPHLIAWSGGKGLHVHVFFKLPEIEIGQGFEGMSEEELTEALFSIDPPKVVRLTLYRCLVEGAGVGPSADLDLTRVDWSSQGQGMLIREFGAPRPDGANKTLLEAIPASRPKPRDLPLVFPERVPEWDASAYDETIAAAIGRALICRLDGRSREGIVQDGELSKIPCYRALINGRREGSRSDGSFWIARFNWINGYSEEAARAEVVRYSTNCIPTDSELEKRCLRSLESVYRSGQRVKENPGCNKIRQRFGPGVCDRSSCFYSGGGE